MTSFDANDEFVESNEMKTEQEARDNAGAPILPGDRVVAVTAIPGTSVQANEEGVVFTGVGNLLVKWDNGRTLSMSTSEGEFLLVTDPGAFEAKRVSVTPGMARAMKRLAAHAACTECGFHVPKYVGRYPSVCPGCGHTFGSGHKRVDSKIMQRALRLLEGDVSNEALLRKVYESYGVKGESGSMLDTKQVRSPDRKLQAEGLFFDDDGYHVELSARDAKGSRLEKAFGSRPDLRAWLEMVPFVDAQRALQVLEGISSKRMTTEVVRSWINRRARSYWGEAHLVYEQRDCCTGTLTVYAPDMYNIPLETLDVPPTSFKREARKRYRAEPSGWEGWQEHLEAFGGKGGEDHELLSMDPSDYEVDLHLTLKPGVGVENQVPGEDMVEIRIPGFNIMTIPAGIVNAWLEGMSQGNMTDPGIDDRKVRVTVDEAFELLLRSGSFLDDYSTGVGTGRVTTADQLLQYLRTCQGTVPRLEQSQRVTMGEPMVGRAVVFRAPSGAMVEGEVIGQDGGIIVVRSVDGSINTVDIENVVSTEVVTHDGVRGLPDWTVKWSDGTIIHISDAESEEDARERAEMIHDQPRRRGFDPQATIISIEKDESWHRKEDITTGHVGTLPDRPLGKAQRAPTVVKKDGSLGTKGSECPPGMTFDFTTGKCVKEEDATTFLVQQGLLPLNEGARVWMDGEEYRILQVLESGQVDLVKMDRTATILHGISAVNLDHVEQAGARPTDAQTKALDQMKASAREVGGTIFVLETKDDGSLLVSDGTQLVLIDPSGNVSRQ